jgi:putative tryptophan/tyrosine transport system substrate-binding protein
MWCSAVGCIVTLTLSLLTASLAAAAQRPAPIPRIGVLRMGAWPAPFVEAFRQGLQDLGYLAGQNVTIEDRLTAADPAGLATLAAELVRLPVAVLFVVGPAALQAAMQATEQIPIVAVDLASDPVQSGFAASLARPGGTITGVFLDIPGLVGKRLELLKEVMPQLARVTVLWDPTTGAVQRDAAHAAARVLALELSTLEVRTDAEFAVNSRLPAISPFRDFPEAGGLMAYGPPLPELFRRCGVQVGKILQGAKPGDLPIERPVRFELVLNLKTAEALGLTISPTLLFQADEVIR